MLSAAKLLIPLWSRYRLSAPAQGIDSFTFTFDCSWAVIRQLFACFLKGPREGGLFDSGATKVGNELRG